MTTLAAGRFNARSICGVLAAISLYLAGAPAVMAQTVCVDDAAQALTRAIGYHRRIGLDGAAAKLLDGAALERAQWCPQSEDDAACAERFKRGAQDYVRRLGDTAVLLYARDRDSVCAFLFSPGSKLSYGRTAIKQDAFDTIASSLRRRFALDLESGAAASKRALTTRRLTALRSGVCDAAAADASSGDRGFSVEAAVSASSAASEAEMTTALFPKAIRGELARVRHVSVIPFGPISTLPLAAFKPFGDDRASVDLFTINYLLFAGEVGRPPDVWTGAPKAPLFFSNPEPRDPVRAKCVSPLPGAEKEAEFAKSILGGTNLSRAMATRQAFEAQAKSADMIYFAAHGLAGVESGIDDSFIALADENLTARDVQRVSQFGFKTRLVVMSACQTGLGRIDEFGVIGLARTFLDAGAQNAVMTLWNVDDSSTATLMEAFSRNLASHQPAEALALAQRTVKSDPATAAPFYWAGFAVYGNRLSSTP